MLSSSSASKEKVVQPLIFSQLTVTYLARPIPGKVYWLSGQVKRLQLTKIIAYHLLSYLQSHENGLMCNQKKSSLTDMSNYIL